VKRPLLRIICSEHDRMIGRVIATESGPAFQTRQPFGSRKPLFLGDDGTPQFDLPAKSGQRVQEWAFQAHVALDSNEAREAVFYTAWCPACRKHHRLEVETMLQTRGTLRV
jgi:hypothetical protein